MIQTRGNKKRKKSPFYAEEQARDKKKKRGGSFFAGIGRFILLIMIGCAAGMAGGALQGYFYFTHDLPNIESLKNYSPPIVTQVYASGGTLIAEFAKEQRFVKPIEEIPKALQNAFISAEDKNFWTHTGVDEQAIARAVVQNIKSGRVDSGASTITQQVAKNFLLTSERTLTRKIKEFILSRRIEDALTKREILHLYLNQIYFGHGAYGVEAAAREYFGKHVNELTIAECAMIGGLAKAPAAKNPKTNLKKALARRSYVLFRMKEDGHITPAEYEAAKKEPTHLAYSENPYKKIVPGFSEHVRRYIEKKYGADVLYKEGLKVYTTVDLQLTKAARNAVLTGLEELDRRQGYRGPLGTPNVQGIVEFLQRQTESRGGPLRFGDITKGVVTKIDDKFIYVRMGSYIKGDQRHEYMGRVTIDPDPKWWVRKPYVRPDMRKRNFAEGELPFREGDIIEARLVDPNETRRELYLKRYGRTDPEMKNYKHVTEDMLPYFPLEVYQEPVAQAALMLRENKTGYVRAMIGGREKDAKFNRAVQAHRQPGSSFKPVVYTAALNSGFDCAQIVLDSPFAYPLSDTGSAGFWRPKNFSGGYRGRMTFREALVRSQNIPAAKILQHIGVDRAIEYARKMGYTSHIISNLSIALGSTGQGVSLEEQLGAYSVFPNKGFLVKSVFITKIVDRNGKILEQNDPPILMDDPTQVDEPQISNVSYNEQSAGNPVEGAEEVGPKVLRRVVDEGSAVIMTDILQDVVQNGTARVLKKIVGRTDIAGKTGTTNEGVDAWFMGFSPDYTCGVWVGFDDHHTLGRGETGGKAAAPIWGRFMKEVLKDIPIRDFPGSEAVEPRWIDPQNGLVVAEGEGVEMLFKKGSAPQAVNADMASRSPADHLDSGSDLDQF